jgi:hypothetical protein
MPPLRVVLALALISGAIGYNVQQSSAVKQAATTPWTTRRSALSAAMTILAVPTIARAANGTAAEEPAFDYAAFFGPFSCEWWGLERSPGSNQCKDKSK